MKVGILTYHRARNYGAFLQAYALCKQLQQSGFNAELVDFNMKKEEELYYGHSWRTVLLHPAYMRFTSRKSESFTKAFGLLPVSRERCTSDHIENFSSLVKDHYDVIIAGSDEIWKATGFRGFPTPYWLPGDLGCRKLSYAASSRTDFSAQPASVQEQARELLNDFEYITVRDQSTYEQFKNVLHVDVPMDMAADPSFIYDYPVDPQAGRELICRKAGLSANQKIAFVMIDSEKVASAIRKQLRNEYQLVSVFTRHTGYKNVPDLDPFEWLNVLAGADLVLTSFFHPTCFAIVNNVPFLSFATGARNDKVGDVLQRSGNARHFIRVDDGLFKGDKLRRLVAEASADIDATYVMRARGLFAGFVERLKG